MAIRCLILCWTLIGAQLAAGQAQHTHWFMGFNAGLHFQGGGPISTGGPLSTDEGCASIADANGQLLFFTNGEQVWDRNLNVMPNGTGLLGHFSSSQSALIVPVPGTVDQYELFTAPSGAGFWSPTDAGYHYRVDMTANGGLGDVVGVGQALAAPLSEKLTATRHANGVDIWVVLHGWNNASYYAYLLTCTGVEGPVVSTIGHQPGYDAMGEAEGYVGCMKVSQQGDRLANVWTRNTLATQSEYQSDVIIDLLDLDNNTGILSNLRSDTLAMGNNLVQGYGVAFSPNGKLLYTTDNGLYNGGFQAHIRQYDLTLPFDDPVLIANASPKAFGTLQLAPDGALYIARTNGATYLSRITDPDVVGAGCGFVDEGASLGTDKSTWGLPNHWDTYPEPVPFDPIAMADTLICGAVDLILDATYVHPFHVPDYLWSTGETTATIAVSQAGTYTVELLLPCTTLVDTVRVERGGIDLSLGEDISICDDRTATLSVPEALSILWSTGDTLQSIILAEEGTYSVQLTDTLGCITTDSLHLSMRNCACAMYLPTAFSPNNDGINDMLQAVMECDPEAFDLEVFDRWGGSLFHSTDALLPWTAAGIPAGIYAYRLSYAWDDGATQQRRTSTGHVTVLR